MTKKRAMQVLDWWINAHPYKDAQGDEEIWHQIEGGEIVTYTYNDLKLYADDY